MSGASSFQPTRWTQIDLLRTGSDSDRGAAMSTLYELYRRPILAFLASRGFAQERAEDLFQDFFLYSIQHHLFEKADRDRGRFRNLILSALQNYAANAHRKEQARFRKPSGGFAAEDVTDLPPATLPADTATPESAFVRSWAETLIRRVLMLLEAEYAGPNRRAHYDIFHRLMIAPILEGAAAPTQRELAEELGLMEKEVANRLVTARRAYQRLLRAEIAAYAHNEAEIDDEIRELFQQLSKS
jgi:RNA polymerase sigma-70 factor (ECF subfamily)